MTLAELRQVFTTALLDGKDGLRAVVTALRDEFDLKLPFEMSMTIEEILKSFDKILASDGEGKCQCKIEMATFRYKGDPCPHCGDIIG